MPRTFASFLLIALMAFPACAGDNPSPQSDGGNVPAEVVDSGASNSTGGKVACNYPNKLQCGALTVMAAAAEVARDMCSRDVGLPVTVCPSENLIGCCTQMALQTCFYTGGSKTAAQAQMGCSAGNGLWSTSP